MLQVIDVFKAYGTRTLLNGVTFQINPTSRIGLVGRNGAGKSTLFKLIMGEMEPDQGRITRMPGTAIRCLTQELHINTENTLFAEVMSALPALGDLETEEANLFAHWEELNEAQQLDACSRLAEITHMKEQLGHLEGNVSRLLTGLGFGLHEFDRLVGHFSGGWQMRINLAKVLVQGAEFLLLDEPTNHLDLEAREWLEGFLKDYPGGLLIVTHDRQFLDKVVTEIAEIELGKLTVWPGNYTKSLQMKAEAQQRLEAAAERQTKELAKQQAFVDRFRASATKSTQAKSREKQLAKIERIEVTKTDTSRLRVQFPVPPRSGRHVLSLKGVAKAFGPRVLFEALEGEIERQQRVFLLGANGMGKTTLLRLILGLETADAGTIELGGEVNIGYFSQHQLETLDPELSALQTLEKVAPITMEQTEVRGVLGRFLFQGEEAFKQVKVLSGGEKSRLALARLLLSNANFLLLDEPTNHMDIPAQLAMEQAFREYQGTLLCISHDRYLIQEVATDIWELHHGEVLVYRGNYDYYLSKRDEVRADADAKRAKRLAKAKNTPAKAVAVVNEAHVAHEQAKQAQKVSTKALSKLEKAIMAKEAEVAAVQAQVEAAATDYTQAASLGAQLQALEAELAELNTQWSALLDGATV
jgi:ATP-binding cassette subfamily F protein 3